jgi:hypothetical protein
MLIVAVCATLLVGVGLGLRFNVFVLLPATMLALLCTGVVGAIVAASVVSILVACFMSAPLFRLVIPSAC